MRGKFEHHDRVSVSMNLTVLSSVSVVERP